MHHFGGKNVILLSFYNEVLQKCCHIKTSQEHSSSFNIFLIGKKSQLPAIRTAEQRILLIKRKINHPGYKFSKYFY